MVSDGFWNKYSKKISNLLSLHQETDFQDTGTYFNGCLQDSERDLFQCKKINTLLQKKNYPKKLWKLSPHTQQNTTEDEITTCQKIRMFPNTQKIFIDNFISDYDFIYNQCIDIIKNKNYQKLSSIEFKKEYSKITRIEP